MASLIVAVVMIVFVLFYDRSQIHIGTILYQIVYSFCVDLFAKVHVYSTHMWINALLMLLDAVMVISGVLLGGKFEICTIVTILIPGSIIQFTASKTKAVFHI